MSNVVKIHHEMESFERRTKQLEKQVHRLAAVLLELIEETDEKGFALFSKSAISRATEALKEVLL